MRIKSKWHKTDRRKTPEEIASVLAFNSWKIAMNRLDHLQDEEFPIRDNEQRFGILREFLAFQLQAADRTAYEVMDDDDRRRLITSMANRLARILEENLVELYGPGDYQRPFVELLNRRSQDYAELTYGSDGPGYSFLRYFAEQVADAVGAEHNKWVLEQVMDIEAPEAVKLMKKAFSDQLSA